MAPRWTPCTCTANTLAVFIRRVAHIDLAPTLRCDWNVNSLHGARRSLNTLHPLQSRGISHHETNTTTHTTVNLQESMPFDRTRLKGLLDPSKSSGWPLQSSTTENLEPGMWAVDPSQNEHKVAASDSFSLNLTHKLRRTSSNNNPSSFSETTIQDESAAAFFEFNPETIDALAANSLEDNLRAKRNVTKPTWKARPSRTRAPAKGFKLHYSTPPIATTPKAIEAKLRDSKTAKSSISNSRANDHLRHRITERQPWQVQKAALGEKFEGGWNPRKKLSPDALAGIRAIHAQFPEQYTTSVLAEKFEVSPEAIRRILKSQWTPKEEEVLDRQRRWFLRGQKVWSRYSELGLKPPARWRKLGIGNKNKLGAGRRGWKSMNKKITTQSTDCAARKSDVELPATATSMSKRIL